MVDRIDPARMAFDFDGVLADTMRLFLQIAQIEFGITSIEYEDITDYELEECLALESHVIDAIIDRILDGRCNHWLQPIPGAINILTKIAQQTNKLLFVTARPSADSLDEWINHVLPAVAATMEIVATGSFDKKVGILLQHKMAYFVEDRLETCFALAAAGIRPILFRQPWNRQEHPFTEVSDWQALAKLIDFNGYKPTP